MNCTFIKTFTLLTAAIGITGCMNQQKETQRPNVLFIFSDDHATHAIGAYGPKHNNPGLYQYVQTPNLDRPHRGILSDRYKLIHFFTIDERELFDLETDPDEIQNVNFNPGCHVIMEDMTSRLEKEQISVGGTVEMLATSRYYR